MLDMHAHADRRRFCDRLSFMSDTKSVSSGPHSCEQASLSHRLRPLRPCRDGLRPQAGRHLCVRARRLRRPRRRAHRAARAAPLVLARGRVRRRGRLHATGVGGRHLQVSPPQGRRLPRVARLPLLGHARRHHRGPPPREAAPHRDVGGVGDVLLQHHRLARPLLHPQAGQGDRLPLPARGPGHVCRPRHGGPVQGAADDRRLAGAEEGGAEAEGGRAAHAGYHRDRHLRAGAAGDVRSLHPARLPPLHLLPRLARLHRARPRHARRGRAAGAKGILKGAAPSERRCRES
mmetsp:Transcript_7316/g.24120  ORF Transcript_7316/g.24120 Transcript_7316/m.24120 type:complete len:290 (-) Transcript_7316:391-1260(-)